MEEEPHPPRGPTPRARRRTSVESAALTAWFALVAFHLLVGGLRFGWRLARHEPLPSGSTATSDWWLDRALVGAATPEVEALLARVPRDEAILLFERNERRSPVPAWPFISYVAWPRHLWMFNCDGAEVKYYVWPEDPDLHRVPWILFSDLTPPKTLRAVGTAGRLTLVATDSRVPWTSYCSP
jgi:hypothetical protein